MKKDLINLSIDKELLKQLQIVANDFSVPRALLIDRVLWQFVSDTSNS